MCYVELGGQNNSEGKLPFPVPCYVIRVRAATSQLQRNSLLRVGTLHVEMIEECQSDIHNKSHILCQFAVYHICKRCKTIRSTLPKEIFGDVTLEQSST